MKTLEIAKSAALSKILFATDFSPCSEAAFLMHYGLPINMARSCAPHTSFRQKRTCSPRPRAGLH